MTANANTPSRSRGAMRPRFAINLRPFKQKAWGMPGARCTRSLVCAMGNKYAHEYSKRAIGNHPTFPHAMVYGLYRALPGDRLSCHRRQRLPANLTPASGCQDHTSSPSAASNARQARRRVHRIPPRVRDVASRPSEWDGTARDILLIWVRPQAIFLKFRNYLGCAPWEGKSALGRVREARQPERK